MELSEMRGIGPARMESLRAVGIVSLRDLLYTLPVPALSTFLSNGQLEMLE